MATLEAVQGIMMRVGTTLDLQQVTEFAEDGAWSLIFDATTTIDAEYDEARQRVIFTGDIGAVPAQARERALELLLQYSYLWPEHGGVRAALDGPSGHAVLMVDLAAQDIELTRFCDALSNFRAVVDGWRNVLASMTTRGGATGASLDMTGFIRV